MRVRFLKAILPLKTADLANSLSNVRYDDDFCSKGFEYIKDYEDRIEAKYIEKVLLEEKVVDPFGNESFVESISYNFFSFLIYKNAGLDGYRLIVVKNPSRSLKGFVKSLSSAVGYGLYLEDLEISVLDFIEQLRNSENISIISVGKLKASNIFVSKQSNASVELSSTLNALDDLNDFLPHSDYKIDKVSLNVLIGDDCYPLTFTKRASFHFPETIFVPLERAFKLYFVGSK